MKVEGVGEGLAALLFLGLGVNIPTNQCVFSYVFVCLYPMSRCRRSKSAWGIYLLEAQQPPVFLQLCRCTKKTSLSLFIPESLGKKMVIILLCSEVNFSSFKI